MQGSRYLRGYLLRMLLLLGGLLLGGVLYLEGAPRKESLREDLEKALLLRMKDGVLPRASGMAYAVDGATLLLYAVESENLPLFEDLWKSFREVFVVPVDFGGPDALTICWKRHPGEPPDASGTTETVLTAKALWKAGHRWGRQDFLEQSLGFLRGYLGHISGEGRSWQIRNYYNYGTRAFATNSYALGYYPDFLAEVARSGLLPEAKEAEVNSLNFLRNAALPNGLFASSFDPELRTLFPDSEVSYHFSPNFRIKVGDSAFIALEMLRGDEEIPRKTLGYLRTLWPSMPDTIYGFLSFPLSPEDASRGISTGHLAAVYRLALELDQEFARTIRPVLYRRGEALLKDRSGEAWGWDAANLLLALAREAREGR